MRHLLGTLALLLAVLPGLAACGDDDGTTRETITDPAPPAPPVLVHATAGEGEPASSATMLEDDAALEEYVAQFDDALAGKVQRAAADVEVGGGLVLAAQVVAIGCDVPPAATYRDGAFVAAKVASPLQECLAPVTTVALAAVSE